jgi:hypothetical protein
MKTTVPEIKKIAFNKFNYDTELFEKHFPDMPYRLTESDDMIKILITQYNGIPKNKTLPNPKFRIVFNIHQKEDDEDVACIYLNTLETQLFEIVANNYNITEILGKGNTYPYEQKGNTYPYEQNGIDYRWYPKNVKEIYVIKNTCDNLKEAQIGNKQIPYIEKDARKFNKHIGTFIKYYKQDPKFIGFSIYEYDSKYHLIIYLKKAII